MRKKAPSIPPTKPENWFSNFLPLLEANPIAIVSLRDLRSRGCNPMLLSTLLYLACRNNPEMEAERDKRKRALQLTSEVLSALKVTVANLNEIGKLFEEPDTLLPELTKRFRDLADVIEGVLQREIPDSRSRQHRNARSDESISSDLGLPSSSTSADPSVMGSSMNLVLSSLGDSEIEYTRNRRFDSSKRGYLRPAMQSVPLFEYLKDVTGGPRLNEIQHLLRLGQKAVGGVDGIELIYKRYQRHRKQFSAEAEICRVIVRKMASRYEETVPNPEERKIEADLHRILRKGDRLKKAKKGTSQGAAPAGNAPAASLL